MISTLLFAPSLLEHVLTSLHSYLRLGSAFLPTQNVAAKEYCRISLDSYGRQWPS